jgi:alpha-D-ribose 1-methylphosphonate 5-triphosphate synthase subunit PhnH
MVRETAYDEVFDAQEHFRSILDSLARPGRINPLHPVKLNPPPGLNHASVLVALALMDADVTFHVVHDDRGESAYLTANTRAADAPLEEAAFIFAEGADPAEILESADCGSLPYPDTSASLILQLKAASPQPLTDGLRLKVEGPGVDGDSVLFVRGLNPDLLLALMARNAEFPMGIDSVLTFVDESGSPYVVGIPRTARIAWEQIPPEK